jgi:hypothetical protein
MMLMMRQARRMKGEAAEEAAVGSLGQGQLSRTTTMKKRRRLL